MSFIPLKLPRWADAPTDPAPEFAVIEPSESVKNQGYIGAKPPFSGLNWLLNTIYNWILYLSRVVIPVGTVLFWHKSLTGVPALGFSCFVECNGQTLSDADSPLNGQVIPNINGEKRFIRGGATSGALQASQNKSQGITGSGTDDISVVFAGLPGGSSTPLCFFNNGGTSYQQAPPTGGPYGINGNVHVSSNSIAAKLSLGAGTPDESRPDCITLVAIMRVK